MQPTRALTQLEDGGFLEVVERQLCGRSYHCRATAFLYHHQAKLKDGRKSLFVKDVIPMELKQSMWCVDQSPNYASQVMKVMPEKLRIGCPTKQKRHGGNGSCAAMRPCL